MRRELIKKISKNPFLQSVFILMGGSVVSQLIPFAASPLLGRIYSPELFSVLALFLSTVNILDVFATLKYDLAVVVAENDDDASGTFWLCVVINTVLSALVLLLMPAVARLLPGFAGQDGGWLYLVPFSVLFTSLFSTLSYYNLRLGRYKRITQANIVRSVAAAALQIGLGLLGFGAYGLMLGQTGAYLAGCVMLLYDARRYLPRPHRGLLRACAKRHREFPIYTLPGTLANTLSYNLISYFLKAFFVPAQLGYYSLVNQVLSAPLTVISGAVGNVFLKRSADDANANTLGVKTFDAITRTLFFLSVPIFAVLYFFASPLLRFFLGEQWAAAGDIVRVLTPMFLVRFVVTPVTGSAIVAGRQGASMVWQLSLLAASVLPALVQLTHPLSATRYLSLLSLLLAASYAVFYLYCRRLLRQKEKNAA